MNTSQTEKPQVVGRIAHHISGEAVRVTLTAAGLSLPDGALLYDGPAVQVEPVGYIRRSAIELMESDELGVRANIIKEPRYRDCVPLYTASQPAEQQLDLHLFAKRMDEELEKHDLQGFEPVVLAVAEEVLGYEQQPATDVAEEWSRAFLQIAVVLEALTSSDSDERLSRMNAADVLGEAFATLGRIRQMASPDVAALVEALEAARQFIVNGIEVGAVRMPDSDTPDPAHNTLPMIDAALAAHRKQGGE